MFNLKSKQNGFTFIEVAVASVVFVMVIIGIVQIASKISLYSVRDRNRIKANSFAQKLLEEAQSQSGSPSFDNDDEFQIILPDKPAHTDLDFPNLTASRTISPIANGQRDVNITISWPESSTTRKVDYFLKLTRNDNIGAGGWEVIGNILDSTSGEGIEGVKITGATAIDAANNSYPHPEVTTNNTGSFTLSNLHYGLDQEIRATKGGSDPDTDFASFVQGYYKKSTGSSYSSTKFRRSVNFPDSQDGVPDVIPANSNLENEIRLDKLGYIIGKVTCPSLGLNLSGIKVSAYSHIKIKNCKVSTAPGAVILPDGYQPTDPSVSFIFYNMKPQTQSPWTYPKDGSDPPLQQGDPDFEWGYCGGSAVYDGSVPCPVLDIKVKRYGWLTGTITDGSDNKNLRDARVTTMGYSINTNSNFSGTNYTLYNLYKSENPPGSVNISVSKTGYMPRSNLYPYPAAVVDQANTCDLKIWPTNYAPTVSGTITLHFPDGSSRPAKTNEVGISATGYEYNQINATCDNSGHYLLTGLMPSYGTAPPDNDPGTWSSAKQSFFFSPQAVVGTAVGGDITGTVTDNVSGVPLSGASVWYGNTTTTTNSAGQYIIRNVQLSAGLKSVWKYLFLPPGTCFSPLDVDLYPADINLSVIVGASFTGYYTNFQSGNLINGGTAVIDIKLSKSPPSPTNSSVSGNVYLYPNYSFLSGMKVTLTVGGNTTTQTTNASGSFSFSFNSTTYPSVTLSVSDPTGKHAVYGQSSYTFTASPGQNYNYSFYLYKLTGDCTISGRVHNSQTNNGIPNINITDETGTVLATTDTNGNYSVTYTVNAGQTVTLNANHPVVNHGYKAGTPFCWTSVYPGGNYSHDFSLEPKGGF